MQMVSIKLLDAEYGKYYKPAEIVTNLTPIYIYVVVYHDPMISYLGTSFTLEMLSAFI